MGKHPGPRARCLTVVAKEVKKTATPAGARGQRQRKPQATEEQHTEELGAKKRNVGEEGTEVNGPAQTWVPTVT